MTDRTYTTPHKNEESRLGAIEFSMKEQTLAKARLNSNTMEGENLFSLITDQFLLNLIYKYTQLTGTRGMKLKRSFWINYLAGHSHLKELRSRYLNLALKTGFLYKNTILYLFSSCMLHLIILI